MVTVALALGASMLIGLSDFLMGVAGRRGDPLFNTTVMQTSAAVLLVPLALIYGAEAVSGPDALHSALAGVGSGGGALVFFWAMTNGRMGLVVPVAGLVAAFFMVVVGLLSGDRLSWPAGVGIVAGLVSIPMITFDASPGLDRPRLSTRAQLGAAALAGLGFGVEYSLLGATSQDAGMWPAAICFGVGACCTAAFVLARGRRTWRPARLPLGIGGLVAVGMGTMTLALQRGPLTVVAILGNLYPVVTVALGVAVLGVRLHRPNVIGIALATVAVALITGAR